MASSEADHGTGAFVRFRSAGGIHSAETHRMWFVIFVEA